MGADVHRAEPRALEQRAQRLGLADREPVRLVELGVARAHRDRRVPEVPDHLHAARVVPDVRGDAAARLRDPGHLARHGRVVLDEVQDQARDRHVEGARLPRQAGRVAGDEADARVAQALPRRGHEPLGGVHALDRRGLAGRQDGLREGAGPAADVPPGEPARRREPAQQLRRHLPAPSADVALVRVAGAPGLGRRRLARRLTR